MRVIRQTSFTEAPWKNGGGLTREALRVPPGAPDFLWRVSLARIDGSGPFSSFPGYLRKMVLLRGAGVRLSIDGARHAELRTVGDMAEFDGAASTQCELIDGPCTDLNLMCARSRCSSSASIAPVVEPRLLACGPGQSALAFAISGSISITGSDETRTTVSAWDLVVIADGEQALVCGAAADEPLAPLVFFAVLTCDTH